MLPLPLYEIVLDAREPRELAEFYHRLTGWEYVAGHEETDPQSDDWLALVAPGGGARLAFQRSVATTPPWPQGARIHVDLRVANLDEGHRHALACGARPLTGTPEDEARPQDPFRVYADPMGHPFCLVQPSA